MNISFHVLIFRATGYILYLDLMKLGIYSGFFPADRQISYKNEWLLMYRVLLGLFADGSKEIKMMLKVSFLRRAGTIFSLVDSIEADLYDAQETLSWREGNLIFTSKNAAMKLRG